MKNTFKWMSAAILICGLAIVSCKKDPVPTPDPTPEPDPEPQTVMRLSLERNVKSNLLVETTFHWENGILMQVDQAASVPAYNFNQIAQNKFVYENGDIVSIDELSDKWHYIYNYENGQLKTFLSTMENDTTSFGEVTAYTEDGYVKEIMVDFGSSKHRYTLTWVDGDATEVIRETLEPEEMAGTTVLNYTYDNNPNAYTAVPLAWAIIDGNGFKLANILSKHNKIADSFTYDYNEEGYLISCIKENDSTFYNYIEQTLR